jgi:hypothetical protein
MQHAALHKRKRRALTAEQLTIVRESLRIAIRDRTLYVADPRNDEGRVLARNVAHKLRSKSDGPV